MQPLSAATGGVGTSSTAAARRRRKARRTPRTLNGAAGDPCALALTVPSELTSGPVPGIATEGEASLPPSGEGPGDRTRESESMGGDVRVPRRSLRLLTVKEAAALLGCGRHRLTRALKAGQILAVCLGARLMVPIRELERFTAAVSVPARRGREEEKARPKAQSPKSCGHAS